MASKRRLRRKACEGKQSYATLEAATAVTQRLRGLNAYKCKHCSGFHVGHPPGRVRQSLAAKRRHELGQR